MEEKKIKINGYILNADSHEDHKRSMLFEVFDVLDMDFEKEIDLYRRCQEQRNTEIMKKEPRCEQGSLKGKDVEILCALCAPLAKLMKEKCSPHDTLIITDEYFKIVTDSICILFNEDE